MPQSDIGVLLVIGAVFFLIGILGGGFEISAIKVPSIGKTPRLIITAIGAVFMVIGIGRLFSPISTPPTNTIEPTASLVPTSRDDFEPTSTAFVVQVTQAEATETAIEQPQAAMDCLSSDYIPPLTGIHPPVETEICIPSNTIAWISSDPAQISIPSASYSNTFTVGYTFVLFGPVKFTISGVENQNVWLDSRTNTSLIGNFDGKTINVVYQDGKVCDYALYTGSACP